MPDRLVLSASLINGALWECVHGSGAATFQQHGAEKAAGGGLGGDRLPDRPCGMLLPNSGPPAPGPPGRRGPVPVGSVPARPDRAGRVE